MSVYCDVMTNQSHLKRRRNAENHTHNGMKGMLYQHNDAGISFPKSMRFNDINIYGGDTESISSDGEYSAQSHGKFVPPVLRSMSLPSNSTRHRPHIPSDIFSTVIADAMETVRRASSEQTIKPIQLVETPLDKYLESHDISEELLNPGPPSYSPWKINEDVASASKCSSHLSSKENDKNSEKKSVCSSDVTMSSNSPLSPPVSNNVTQKTDEADNKEEVIEIIDLDEGGEPEDDGKFLNINIL